MSVSYADAASTKVPGKPEESSEQPVSQNSDVSETIPATEQKESRSTETEKTEKPSKALAPAPVPAKSVWGSTATQSSASMVDEQKFPTPGQVPQAAQNSNKNSAKFVKSNKWIPITAKVVFTSPRNAPSSSGNGSSQKGKRKSKAPRKKSTSGGPHVEGSLKKDDASKEDDSETVATDGASESDALHSSSEAHSQQQSGDAKQRSTNSSNYNQQKGYKKYQNGSYGSRASGSQQQQLPLHRHQSNGYYQPMIPQQFQANNKQYRSMSNSYGRNGSNGNLAMPGYTGPNSRSMQGSMTFIPHHPQPMMGGMPYAPMPVQIPPPLSPKQNPQQALTQQIDYYFSLENLIRDLFLRKNMGTEGWVDLDLILNFKRVEIIINGLRNSIEEEDEKVKEETLDKAIVTAVQQCENLEIGYLNGKEDYNATATEIQLRVKYNFEQWLLPDNVL
ncbi:hypothetical protein PUMCH_002338 [Australozyma saopauloensis]|uniref:HTH La-type RNA-binding domain-containing protein n=1 Tax=Australozyma saopauloensis TaxID=291208 RepID=A0AAX4H987_9ASCO|nr:hypothetical protein PUMCH_002338 [[Candida] saopauloensis]